jgi:hypothetical protein
MGFFCHCKEKDSNHHNYKYPTSAAESLANRENQVSVCDLFGYDELGLTAHL